MSMLCRALVVVLVVGALGSSHAAAPTTYGKGVTLATATPIDRLLRDPSAFEGKTVRVEGVVTAVCQMMGCWMALGTKDAAGVPTVMIKVDDGVIVLPVSAKGKKAAAQGVVERIKGDDHEGNEAAREKAQAASSAPAAASAPSPKTAVADTWQVKATGAVVY